MSAPKVVREAAGAEGVRIEWLTPFDAGRAGLAAAQEREAGREARLVRAALLHVQAEGRVLLHHREEVGQDSRLPGDVAHEELPHPVGD